MRITALAVAAAALLGIAGAQAQTLEVGPGGVGVDMRGPRERARDEDRREEFRDRRRAERFRDRDDYRRGGRRCREVTVRSRNEYGERVTRTRRECS